MSSSSSKSDSSLPKAKKDEPASVASIGAGEDKGKCDELATISSSRSSPTREREPVRTENFPKLYGSYFFAAWGDRMWEFAAIIFLINIFPTSLFPSSLFGFAETIAGIVFGTTIGNYVDSTDRLTVIRVSIITQNVVILFASLVFVFALQTAEEERAVRNNTSDTNAAGSAAPRVVVVFYNSFLVDASTTDLVTLALIVISGMVAKVSSSLNKISIHKDWAVVLAGGDSKAQTTLNANMRRVDLTCAILAPLAVGVLSSVFSPMIACKFIASWSFVSMFIEFRLSKTVYDDLPALQVPKRKQKAAAAADEASSGESEQAENEKKKNKKKGGGGGGKEEEDEDMSFFQLFDAYLTHPVFPISLPYCLLYISVLSFGGIMVAFLRTLGCSDWLLALGRALAAFVAIGSTFCVPSLVENLGLVSAGKLCLWLQIAALTPLAGVFFISLQHKHMPTDDPAAITEQTSVLFIGVVFASICLSRFGLWSFDIVQTQMMQESILLSYAGRVNGGQEILMNACYLVSYALTMVEDDPTKFAVPALVSYGSIFLAGVLFLLFAQESFSVCKERKELAEKREAEAVGFESQ